MRHQFRNDILLTVYYIFDEKQIKNNNFLKKEIGALVHIACLGILRRYKHKL